MILVSYYSDYSINDINSKDENGRFLACKSIEMSRLIYLYIRNYISENEHIYFLDNASPIDPVFLYSFFKEEYEEMASDCYKINKKYRIHFKSFSNKLAFGRGWHRRVFDFLKIAYFNDEDFLMFDMDSLCAYDILLDFKFIDFGAYQINLEGRSCNSFITYISKKRLHDYDLFFNLPDYLDDIALNFSGYVKACGIIAEGGLYNNFCFGDIKEVSEKNKTIHSVKREELISFIETFRINHVFIDEFLSNLSKNINIK